MYYTCLRLLRERWARYHLASLFSPSFAPRLSTACSSWSITGSGGQARIVGSMGSVLHSWHDQAQIVPITHRISTMHDSVLSRECSDGRVRSSIFGCSRFHRWGNGPSGRLYFQATSFWYNQLLEDLKRMSQLQIELLGLALSAAASKFLSSISQPATSLPIGSWLGLFYPCLSFAWLQDFWRTAYPAKSSFQHCLAWGSVMASSPSMSQLGCCSGKIGLQA